MNPTLKIALLFTAVAVTAALACDPALCKLPKCLCMGTGTPNNLSKSDTPQLVFLSFDDAITVVNYGNYTEILKNRTNPNGCPISMTFYVTHDYNDYTLTHQLHYQGNEIAVHSTTHVANQTYWKDASENTWTQEIDDLREIVSTFANIPKSSLKGHRAPFLQTGGDTTMKALQKLNMLYDNSYPTQTYMDPPIWPYTLDSPFEQDCAVEPCPHSSFNGTWVVPMVDLIDKENAVCAMADSCARPTDRADTLQFLKGNFLRHYTTNKAPFGIYLHAAWFQGWSHTLYGYLDFLDYLKTLPDVYIVSISKGLEWIKNPVHLGQLSSFAPFNCPASVPSSCQPRDCYYYDTDIGGDRVMRSCVSCPDLYPWLGNPYGIV